MTCYRSYREISFVGKLKWGSLYVFSVLMDALTDMFILSIVIYSKSVTDAFADFLSRLLSTCFPIDF